MNSSIILLSILCVAIILCIIINIECVGSFFIWIFDKKARNTYKEIMPLPWCNTRHIIFDETEGFLSEYISADEYECDRSKYSILVTRKAHDKNDVGIFIKNTYTCVFSSFYKFHTKKILEHLKNSK